MEKILKRILQLVLKKGVLKLGKEKTVTVVVLTVEKRPEFPDSKYGLFGKKIELPVEVAATLVSQGYVKYE